MRVIPWMLAIAFTLFLVFSVHRLAKLPNEPLLAFPSLLLENWEFALGVGLGLPYSDIIGPIILLLILLASYRIIKWLLNTIIRFFRKVEP